MDVAPTTPLVDGDCRDGLDARRRLIAFDAAQTRHRLLVMRAETFDECCSTRGGPYASRSNSDQVSPTALRQARRPLVLEPTSTLAAADGEAKWRWRVSRK